MYDVQVIIHLLLIPDIKHSKNKWQIRFLSCWLQFEAIKGTPARLTARPPAIHQSNNQDFHWKPGIKEEKVTVSPLNIIMNVYVSYLKGRRCRCQAPRSSRQWRCHHSYRFHEYPQTQPASKLNTFNLCKVSDNTQYAIKLFKDYSKALNITRRGERILSLAISFSI